MAVTVSPDLARYLAGLVPNRQDEALRLVQIFAEETGFAPGIWAGRMVGFGRYDHSTDSGQRGTSLATGFAMGRAEISIYIMAGIGDYVDILNDIGPHRLGKSCLYLRRLTPAVEPVLRRLIRASLHDLASRGTIFAQ